MIESSQTSFFDMGQTNKPIKAETLDLDVKIPAIDEIARGILRQALQDCHDNESVIRKEARKWLEVHGETWASGLELDWLTGDRINHFLQYGNGQKRKPYRKKQDSLILGTMGIGV